MTLPAEPTAHPDLAPEAAESYLAPETADFHRAPEAADFHRAPEAAELPGRRLPRPAAFAAVIALGTVILTACLLGAALSGLFGTASKTETGSNRQPPQFTPAPPPDQHSTHFDDGIWLVGRDILAGTYQTTVPADSAGCLWERADSPDGTLSSVLESGAGNPGLLLVVTIKTTDLVFRSHSCGQWQQVAGPDAS